MEAEIDDPLGDILDLDPGALLEATGVENALVRDEPIVP